MFIDEVFSKNLVMIELKDINSGVDLKDINFKVKNNAFICFGGSEQSSSSTLIKLLMGLKNPDSGKIIFSKSPFFSNFSLNKLYMYFGYVNQDNSLYSHLTLHENLVYFAKMYGLNTGIIQKNISELLSLTGLSHLKHKKIISMSHIDVKKSNIACSLIMSPKILFLDHFTSELDYVSRREIFNLLKKLNDNGMTIMMADSDYMPFRDYFTRLVVLKDGVIDYDSNDRSTSEVAYQITIRTLPGYYETYVDDLLKVNSIGSVKEIEGGLVIFLKSQNTTLLNNIVKILKDYGETLIDYKYEMTELKN